MSVAVTPAMGTELARRLTALERVVALSEGRFDADTLGTARGVLVQAEERLQLSGDHTVVAFAGPTGCGKSSLFNAIAELSLSRVGVRRPTTSHTLACAWSQDDAQPLLDWLGVPRARQLSRETVLDAGSQVDLTGLVLLDLPDYDSTEADHQIEVDRLLDLVDVMVWVFDPEKYADALVHEDYLQNLAAHAPVTICVFNQVDRLETGAVKKCIADLRRLLVEDGLGQVDIVATSATTGLGVTELRRLLAARAMQRRAASDRLQADVTAIAGDLAALCGDGRTRAVERSDVDVLVAALGEAAAVPAMADAVAGAYQRRALLATGWPWTRWLRRTRRDLVRRVRPGVPLPVSVPAPRSPHVAVDPEPFTTSAVAPSEVETALRSIGDVAAAGLPVVWADAVRRAARESQAELAEALERAVAEAGVRPRPRTWWSIAGAAQWVFASVVVFGAVWVAVIAGLEVFGASNPPAPEVAAWPLPVFLLIIGAACGLGLSALGRPFVAVDAIRTRRRVEAELNAAVEEIASRLVLDPVRAEQDRYATAVEQLRVAVATPPTTG